MRCSLLAFALVAITAPVLARPLEAELVAREPEPGSPFIFIPPAPPKGGSGGFAQTGSSGNANGGSVYQQATSPWGYIYNGFGSGKSCVLLLLKFEC